jgi:hypothetical protein
MTSRSTLTDNQSLWSDRIAAWKTSGLNQADFCQQNNITLSAFGYWRTRLKKLNQINNPSDEVHFLPVNIKLNTCSSLTLKINHQHSVEVSRGFDADLLTQIIQVVQRVE